MSSSHRCLRKGANLIKKMAQPVEIAPNPPIGGGWRRQAHYAKSDAAMQHNGRLDLMTLKSWL
jgi:hypothetical protein